MAKFGQLVAVEVLVEIGAQFDVDALDGRVQLHQTRLALLGATDSALEPLALLFGLQGKKTNSQPIDEQFIKETAPEEAAAHANPVATKRLVNP